MQKKKLYIVSYVDVIFHTKNTLHATFLKTHPAKQLARQNLMSHAALVYVARPRDDAREPVERSARVHVAADA
jgi:hypothetical protein